MKWIINLGVLAGLIYYYTRFTTFSLLFVTVSSSISSLDEGPIWLLFTGTTLPHQAVRESIDFITVTKGSIQCENNKY